MSTEDISKSMIALIRDLESRDNLGVNELATLELARQFAGEVEVRRIYNPPSHKGAAWETIASDKAYQRFREFSEDTATPPEYSMHFGTWISQSFLAIGQYFDCDESMIVDQARKAFSSITIDESETAGPTWTEYIAEHDLTSTVSPIIVQILGTISPTYVNRRQLRSENPKILVLAMFLLAAVESLHSMDSRPVTFDDVYNRAELAGISGNVTGMFVYQMSLSDHLVVANSSIEEHMIRYFHNFGPNQFVMSELFHEDEDFEFAEAKSFDDIYQVFRSRIAARATMNE